MGYLRAEMGLGQAARGLAATLEASSIEFGIHNVEERNPSRHLDLTWSYKESSEGRYDISVVVVNPDNFAHVAERWQRECFKRRYTIAYWFWELPEIPDSWRESFALVDEVWAGSRFIHDALALVSPVPVFRMPVPVYVNDGGSSGRCDFGLPEKAFLFFNSCDAHSFLRRKNPEGAIAAFKGAFSPSDRQVGLVLKVNNSASAAVEMNALREAISDYPNIYLIDRIMNRAELDSLGNTADCFVSLHRSEGFGLGPAEAMARGKPVIATNWSGNTDYMTPENSMGVGYDLERIGQDCGPYSGEQFWAEPKIEEAADLMRRVANDSSLSQRMGKAGRQTIETHYSPVVLAKVMKQRIAYIRRRLYDVP